MKERSAYRILFAGGGTGGHLFPALAVADKVRQKLPEAEILFVGTKHKIEARVVPKAGYGFKTIWISGFQRKLSFATLLFPLKLFVSLLQALFIVMKFKPVAAVGSGGYVAGPAIFGARVMGAKIILLEQNSYPGITTRLLERFADELHLMFADAQKYLRRKEIHKITGNPVRVSGSGMDRNAAKKKLGLLPDKPTLLVLGGSLGARSINEAVAVNREAFISKGIQVIWQTGNAYYEEFGKYESEFIKTLAFIEDMETAYSAADLLLARAGATTLAEITVLGIPSVLVPSPYVAENHQFFNAKSLADSNAAILLEDAKVKQELAAVVNDTIISDEKLEALKNNALSLGKPQASEIIAESILDFVKNRKGV